MKTRKRAQKPNLYHVQRRTKFPSQRTETKVRRNSTPPLPLCSTCPNCSLDFAAEGNVDTEVKDEDEPFANIEEDSEDEAAKPKKVPKLKPATEPLVTGPADNRFDSLAISDNTKKSIEEMGFETMMPVQAQVRVTPLPFDLT